MSRAPFFASLLLATALAAPAVAAEGPLQPQGWQTGVMRKEDGAFAYCISESRFDGNFAMVLALTPTGDINVGIGQKGAQLPVGQEKPVRIVIDRQPARTIHARAVKPELMVINVGQNDEFLNAVAKAGTMKVDNMTFAMRGSGDAVATLRECVASMSGSANAAAATGGAAPAPASAPAAPAQQAAVAPAAPAAAAPVQAAQAATPASSAEGIRWNPSPIALPGERDAMTLPPSMQREQAQQLTSAQAAAQEALTAAAPATEQAKPEIPAVQPEVASPATQAAVAAPAMAPELVPPAPAQTTIPAIVAVTPITPVVKPLPAQLEALLKAARVRDLEPAAVTSSDVAFAWKSRDMDGTVRELGVPVDSDVVQLAGQHLSRLRQACGATFTPSLGQPEKSGPLQILTGSAACTGNGKSDYTTLVFALRQGVLSIVSHEIDRGRRAAPDRAQAGVVEALKGRQG